MKVLQAIFYAVITVFLFLSMCVLLSFISNKIAFYFGMTPCGSLMIYISLWLLSILTPLFYMVIKDN